MIELTEKQRWFFDEYAVDLNPMRAAKKVGLTQREYDALVTEDVYRDFLLEATRKYNEAQEPEALDKKGKTAAAKPAPSSVELDPADVRREDVNRELISIMTDLKMEAISPGQATASVNVLKALAQVNGLITTELSITSKKKIEDMSTDELYAMLAERDTKMIDAALPSDAESKLNNE